MLHALEKRLPATSVVNDRDGLASILARLERLVEYPEQDAAIALDMQGSDYQKPGMDHAARNPGWRDD